MNLHNAPISSPIAPPYPDPVFFLSSQSYNRISLFTSETRFSGDVIEIALPITCSVPLKEHSEKVQLLHMNLNPFRLDNDACMQMLRLFWFYPVRPMKLHFKKVISDDNYSSILIAFPPQEKDESVKSVWEILI